MFSRSISAVAVMTLVTFADVLVATERRSLDEVIAHVRGMFDAGASRREIAEYVTRVVDDRIVSNNQRTPDEAGQLSESERQRRAEAIVAWSQKGADVDAHYESAHWAWEKGYGHCNENAHTAVHILMMATDGSGVGEMVCGDHIYAIYGMPDVKGDLSTSELRTWKDAWIVDPWQGITKSTAELTNYPSDFHLTKLGLISMEKLGIPGRSTYVRKYENWKNERELDELSDLFANVTFPDASGGDDKTTGADDLEDLFTAVTPGGPTRPESPVVPEDTQDDRPRDDREGDTESLDARAFDGTYLLPHGNSPERIWDRLTWKGLNEGEADVTLHMRPMDARDAAAAAQFGFSKQVHMRAIRENDVFRIRSTNLNRQFAAIARFAASFNLNFFGDDSPGEGSANMVLTLRPAKDLLDVDFEGYLVIQPAGEAAKRQRVTMKYQAPRVP